MIHSFNTTMTPCVGCGKDKVQIEGRFKMKFIGRPDGKLMKGAPGNYEHGEIYRVPYSWSYFKFWELAEDAPELEIPDIDEEDLEFEEFVYVPDEEKEGKVGPPDIPLAPNEFLLPDAHPPEDSLEENIEELEVEKEPVEEVETEPELSREELKKLLDEADVEYYPRVKTSYLRKLVDRLDEEKEEA